MLLINTVSHWQQEADHRLHNVIAFNAPYEPVEPFLSHNRKKTQIDALKSLYFLPRRAQSVALFKNIQFLIVFGPGFADALPRSGFGLVHRASAALVLELCKWLG